MADLDVAISVDEIGPHHFNLKVVFEGQSFDCGTYINRPEALKAGRLFVERKTAEQGGAKKRSRKKGA